MIQEMNLLQESELFSTLSEEELSRLTPLASQYAVIQDAVLFSEGQAASYLYLVVDGQIALQRRVRPPHATRARRTTIAICRAGDAFGWSALVEPYRYTLSAVAWQSSRVVRIQSKILRKALDMYPAMGYKVTKALSGVMARRLGQTTEALINERELFYFNGLKV